MIIRRAVCGDFDGLGRVMFDAVHADPSPYSPAQRDAWLTAPLSGAAWQARLAGQYGVVAEQKTLMGFMTLRPDGYIDLAFILPAARGTGLFRKLYAPIAAQARTLGLGRLWTDASLMAQPAFAVLGFGVLHHEVIERGSQTLARAHMEKQL